MRASENAAKIAVTAANQIFKDGYETGMREGWEAGRRSGVRLALTILERNPDWTAENIREVLDNLAVVAEHETL